MTLSMLLFGLWFLLGASVPILRLSDITPALIGIYAHVLITLSAIGAAAFCIRRRQSLKKDGIGAVWLILGLGLMLWGLGHGIYSYFLIALAGQDPPYPSLADLFFLVQPFSIFIAFLLLATQWSFRQAIPLRATVGALSVFAVSAVIAFGIRGAYWEDSDTDLKVIVDSLYIFPDSLMLAAAAFAALLVTGNRTWWFTFSATLLIYLSNSYYSYHSHEATYQSGSIVDSGWIWAGLLFALGAFYTKGNEDNKG